MLEPLPLSRSRLEALTDGIFAVSMTLLVLDLRFPEPVVVDAEGLQRALLAMLPRLDDYVISFVVLCVFWIAHLRLFRRVRDVDGAFAALNLAFLLFTTFVPPLTSLLDRHAAHPGAAVAYGANLVAILACEAAMWQRGLHRLANETVTDPASVWRAVRRRFAVAIGVVVAGMLIALIEVRLGLASSKASYVYLLLIGAGLMSMGTPRQASAGDAG
jgi:uncharacterized membrane protein